jgi:hypothetical protein
MILTKEREEIFLTLSDESQEKVLKIYEIAILFAKHKMKPINSEEFDYLYDLDYTALCNIVNVYKARLNNIEGE